RLDRRNDAVAQTSRERAEREETEVTRVHEVVPLRDLKSLSPARSSRGAGGHVDPKEDARRNTGYSIVDDWELWEGTDGATRIDHRDQLRQAPRNDRERGVRLPRYSICGAAARAL